MLQLYGNGKLLLTGEYAVLDGAKSLALPVKFGQHLYVVPSGESKIRWKSLDYKDNIWYEHEFPLSAFREASYAAGDKVSQTLFKLLKAAQANNPLFLNEGCDVLTKLTFPENWGLGSSSTLIYLLSEWSGTNPYTLLREAFSGSGYDIACAAAKGPITYTLKDSNPVVQEVSFFPPFSENLFFVFLNRKQDSRQGIQQYRKQNQISKAVLNDISNLTDAMIHCKDLSSFQQLMETHEDIIANLTQLQKAKDLCFQDYSGSIKSLGAWGGDFILAAGDADSPSYFMSKGYQTVLPYQEMVLK